MYRLLKDLEEENGPRPRRATTGEIARAVFWSFFGVRKMRNLKADAAALTPLHLLAGGLIGAVIFVVTLILLVRMLTAG